MSPQLPSHSSSTGTPSLKITNKQSRLFPPALTVTRCATIWDMPYNSPTISNHLPELSHTAVHFWSPKALGWALKELKEDPMTPHQIQACCELSDFLARLHPPLPRPAVHCRLQAQLRVAVKAVRAESGNRGPSGQGRDMYLSALLKRKDRASLSEPTNKASRQGASSLVGLWGQQKLCSRRPGAMVEAKLVQGPGAAGTWEPEEEKTRQCGLLSSWG